LPADRGEASQADENKDETTENFSHLSGPVWRMMAAAAGCRRRTGDGPKHAAPSLAPRPPFE
jgi:hypothetical protein